MKKRKYTGSFTVRGQKFECFVDALTGATYVDTFEIPAQTDEFFEYASQKTNTKPHDWLICYGRLGFKKLSNPNIDSHEFVQNYFNNLLN